MSALSGCRLGAFLEFVKCNAWFLGSLRGYPHPGTLLVLLLIRPVVEEVWEKCSWVSIVSDAFIFFFGLLCFCILYVFCRQANFIIF